MIHAGVSELRTAFKQHRGAQITAPQAKCLLLFYATECALKAVFLSRNKLRSTRDVEPGLLAKGHDLVLWVKRLRLPAEIAGQPPRFRLKRDRASAYEIALAHQAWRYVAPADQDSLGVWSESVSQWAKEELQP